MSSVNTGDGVQQYDYLLVHVDGEYMTHIPPNVLDVEMTSQSLSDLVISLCAAGWQLVEFIDNRSMVMFKRPKTYRE